MSLPSNLPILKLIDNPRQYDRENLFQRDQYNNTPKESKDHIITHYQCLVRLHKWYKSYNPYNEYEAFPRKLNTIQYLTNKKLGLKPKIEACHSCIVGVTITNFSSTTRANQAIAMRYALKFFKNKPLEEKIKWYQFQTRLGFWKNIGF